MFLSHAGEQKRIFVDYLHDSLQNKGIESFLDEYSLMHGHNSWEQINEALDAADVGEEDAPDVHTRRSCQG